MNTIKSLITRYQLASLLILTLLLLAFADTAPEAKRSAVCA